MCMSTYYIQNIVPKNVHLIMQKMCATYHKYDAHTSLCNFKDSFKNSNVTLLLTPSPSPLIIIIIMMMIIIIIIM